jgi:hypothetical protein
MKLCKDCRYLRSSKLGDVCYHPSVTFTDLVDGSVSGIYAHSMRYLKHQCRPEGILFEPKTTLIQKIKDLFVKEGE